MFSTAVSTSSFVSPADMDMLEDESKLLEATNFEQLSVPQAQHAGNHHVLIAFHTSIRIWTPLCHSPQVLVVSYRRSLVQLQTL